MRVLKTITILMIIYVNIVSGAIDENAGNSAAQFLKINPGARIPGLGNAGTSIPGMAESVFYNPAGLGYLNNIEINGNYSKWFEKMNYSSAAAGIPVENIGTFGIGFIGLSYGDIPVVIQNDAGELESSGNTTAGDMAFLLSYGKEVGNILSIGCNVKLVNQTLEEEKSTSFGFDVGVIAKILEERLRIGLVNQNIGSKVKFMKKGYNLPLIIKLGISYEVLKLKKHTGLIAFDTLKPIDDNFKFNAGLEYGFIDMIFVRGGYQVGNDLSNLTVGGGVKVPFRDYFAKIDYAYIPYGELGITHRIGLVFGLGKK